MRCLGVRIVVPFVGCLLCAPIAAQVTKQVSVGQGGVQGNMFSRSPSISADGRYVAFQSEASNLVSGDTNQAWDVFVRDRLLGTVERVSVSSAGLQGNDHSYSPSISADGRCVAFYSSATNLVPEDSNGVVDVFVHDRVSGTTERVSISTGGRQGDADSTSPSLSADGRYVAFESRASTLVPDDTGGFDDVFVRDRESGTTERMSTDSEGHQGNGDCYGNAISADGRYVVFGSAAFNLVPGDTNGAFDIFLRDRQLGTIVRVSVDSTGGEGNDQSVRPSISANDRYVAFTSWASNLVAGDTNTEADVFVRDLQTGMTTRESVDSSGVEGNNASGIFDVSISADGRYVAFCSSANNLVPGDTNFLADDFVRDRQTSTTESVSVSLSGTQGNGSSGMYGQAVSADGRFVAFESDATNLVPHDTTPWGDVFIRDRAATGFTSTCDPGTAGVIACPCLNASSDLGRGCNNSSGSGGAILSASGVAYLSIDSLVLTTSGETSTALSIVMQGDSVISNGVVYGQGVRCLGGPLIRRLFVQQAVAGSIFAPNFSAGDPTVSARSAAKGDVIQPGQSRYYLVYYRDPIVLGGCPASSTFNSTQTGRVDWSP